MVLGHEAPVARVGRVVAVVAHHEVVVHAECIGLGRFSVDVDRAVFDVGVVMAFIVADAALIHSPCAGRKVDCRSLGGNP